eukprot:361615-Chlamydomonas_euryale.AAC.5
MPERGEESKRKATGSRRVLQNKWQEVRNLISGKATVPVRVRVFRGTASGNSWLGMQVHVPHHRHYMSESPHSQWTGCTIFEQ